MSENLAPPMDVPLQDVAINDKFWLEYQHLIRDIVIPYQWNALNDNIPDTEPSHAIENFNIAAGLSHGEFYGMVFQDSDVAKWLEAVAYLLAKKPDPELEKMADDVIELIAQTQQQDGYLNTYFTVKEPDHKWTNLTECHELYCAGHLIEAAVAYYQATGKDKFLTIICRLADHIDATFGKESHKLNGYPGHPEIELALMRLYEATGNARYMALCQYFIEQRGTQHGLQHGVQSHYYDIEYEKRGKTSHYYTYGPAWMTKDKAYSQAHVPIAEQQVAVGHAVRFAYLYSGVAHLARLSGDKDKADTCQRLWQNVIEKQMYITGAIGSQSSGESFSSDYDLPNDTAYTETCASIGLIMFAHRMLQLDSDSVYANVMERALYNTVLAGMALDGKHFFYVNPLEVHPKSIPHNHIYDHVKSTRQRWFGCACCPPNIARLVSSLGQYIYTVKDDAVYVNLYIGSETALKLADQSITIKQSGDYPWQETVKLTIQCDQPVNTTIALRLPDWCQTPSALINGAVIAISSSKGYLKLNRDWQDGDIIELTLPMTILRVKSHSKLRHNAGKVAIQRGPLVYCIEQTDNGEDLHNLSLPRDAAFSLTNGEGILSGKILLKTKAIRTVADDDKAGLYHFNPTAQRQLSQALTLIPYFSWANRGEGEMRVWVTEAL